MTNVPQSSRYGSEYFLFVVGGSSDARAAADTIASLQSELQVELDKLCRVNPRIPFNRIEIWKWDTHATATVGGQDAVVTPEMKRADAAVFVFNERFGEVTWQELILIGKRKPSVPVLTFFPARPPSEALMMDPEGAHNWCDLLKKRRSLSTDWTGPASRAITPLPQYLDLGDLKRLAFDRLVAELVRIASRYAMTPGRSRRGR